MRLRRFRIRTLMILVALIAIAIGGPVQWWENVKWAREEGLEQHCLERAADEYREAANCWEKAAKGEPYVAVAPPRGVAQPPPVIGRITPPSWAADAAIHADEAKLCRMEAAEHHRKKLGSFPVWSLVPIPVPVSGFILVLIMVFSASFAWNLGLNAVVFELSSPKAKAPDPRNPPPPF
jgi:hypothetical protein